MHLYRKRCRALRVLVLRSCAVVLVLVAAAIILVDPARSLIKVSLLQVIRVAGIQGRSIRPADRNGRLTRACSLVVTVLAELLSGLQLSLHGPPVLLGIDLRFIH